MCHATVTGILSCCFTIKELQDSSGHEVLPPSANHVTTTARGLVLTRDLSPNRQELTHDKARELARNEALKETAHDNALSPTGLLRHEARDQALVTSAPAREPSESDSDNDAVVVGRSVRSRTENQKNKKTSPLHTDESEERSPRASGVNKKDPQRNTKKSREKKKVAKETAKRKDDEEEGFVEEGMFGV